MSLDSNDETAKTNDEAGKTLQGTRIAFVGKLASMSKREAARLVREQGAVVVERPDASVHLVVVGEEGLPLGDAGDPDELFDAETREAAEQGSLRVIAETELWQRLGLVEAEQEVRRLYTPAMLAELLGVPVAVIRRWHRRGLIVPVREVRRLPYFDFQEVAAARRLAELLAAGMSPGAIEKKLESLARYLPGVKRPLAQLSVIIEGKEILLRQGDGLIEPGGQLRFDFEAAEQQEVLSEAPCDAHGVLSLATRHDGDLTPTSPDEMCRMAARLEDEGQLEAAVETYRAAMAAAGPVPEICFQVAELLYRLGDLGGARERYFTTIELDEDYVEARANLGCVLAETGQRELAVAAFQGALAYHADYADVHYHLARTLDELARSDEAETHWRAFLDLAPDSPWADQARSRLAGRLPE
ncbi:MAG TPA: MerR family transcriptional regulator [Thermoguttaceae bacterium]|nr:MerR family transcriptional regulator [Thermoguttaceae bacterium]